MRRKKGKKSSVGSIKVSGVNGRKVTYKLATCHSSKAAARERAKAIRKRGTTARVLKSGTRFCIYKGPKAKKRRRRRAS